MNNLIIGVDPAFRKDGFAIAILDENKELTFKTFKVYLHFISWVMNDMPKTAIVGIENSNKQKGLFSMWNNYKGKSMFNRSQVNGLISNAMAVGKNQAASQIAYELFNDYASKVFNISPQEKGEKWDVKTQYYRRVIEDIINRSGYTYTGGKLTQDAADAFKILELTKTKIYYDTARKAR